MRNAKRIWTRRFNICAYLTEEPWIGMTYQFLMWRFSMRKNLVAGRTWSTWLGKPVGLPVHIKRCQLLKSGNINMSERPRTPKSRDHIVSWLWCQYVVLILKKEKITQKLRSKYSHSFHEIFCLRYTLLQLQRSLVLYILYLLMKCFKMYMFSSAENRWKGDWCCVRACVCLND